MTRDDTIKILSILRGAYPQFYRDIEKQEALDTINLWSDMFRYDAAEVVCAAVNALIKADIKGYPPHIGAVKEKIRFFTEEQAMTEAEAWSIVSKALSNGLYGAQEEFEKLPDRIKRLVGSPNQLREWAMMDTETVYSVVASNFQRSYRTRLKQDEELRALPPEMKNIAVTLAQKFEIPSTETNEHAKVGRESFR